MSALPDGWSALERDEIEASCAEPDLVIAMWAGPDDADLALYKDGTVEIEKAAPIDITAHALVEWHRHQRSRAP